MSDTRAETAAWYRDYYERHGADRNSLLNPEVLLQSAATQLAMVAGFRAAGLDPTSAKVLDIGCGDGQSLLIPLAMGVAPERLYGVDVIPERVQAARLRLPSAQLVCSDAAEGCPFGEGQFDVVFSSTMFVQITDEPLASRIAREMLRLTKPTGKLILCDWRYNKPGSPQYRAVTRKRIHSLFEATGEARVRAVFAGALAPPLGRFLSRRRWAATYFAAQRLAPWLVAQVVTVLQKSPR